MYSISICSIFLLSLASNASTDLKEYAIEVYLFNFVYANSNLFMKKAFHLICLETLLNSCFFYLMLIICYISNCPTKTSKYF